jgi:protein-L-isoaspartate(D-aspartate) O-methyltransferase
MQAFDFETARRKMLEQQIRPHEVVDERVLDAIAHTPREDYVPPQYRNLAFADMNVPLGHGQIMLAPKLEGRLLQELGAKPKDKVLEVGTGSGYVTALLARLADRIHSVEIIPELAERAKQNLAGHGVRNVTVELGDAARGWAAHAPYDAILVTGSLPMLPDTWREQLAPGGRLVVIVGYAPAMEALRIERLDQHNWNQTSLFETVIPPLRNAPEPSRFVF